MQGESSAYRYRHTKLFVNPEKRAVLKSVITIASGPNRFNFEKNNEKSTSLHCYMN